MVNWLAVTQDERSQSKRINTLNSKLWNSILSLSHSESCILKKEAVKSHVCLAPEGTCNILKITKKKKGNIFIEIYESKKENSKYLTPPMWAWS